MSENKNYEEDEQIPVSDDRVKQKILVVDDEKVIRILFEKIFTREGYAVRSAKTAERALEILRDESIMLMFLDLNLAGMNGIDLCKNIRKDNYIGIIYAMTGYSDLFSLINCRIAGFDDFFIKPTTVELLLEAAREGFKKLKRWDIDKYNL